MGVIRHMQNVQIKENVIRVLIKTLECFSYMLYFFPVLFIVIMQDFKLLLLDFYKLKCLTLGIIDNLQNNVIYNEKYHRFITYRLLLFRYYINTGPSISFCS